jgi:hypothetical protein
MDHLVVPILMIVFGCFLFALAGYFTSWAKDIGAAKAFILIGFITTVAMAATSFGIWGVTTRAVIETEQSAYNDGVEHGYNKGRLETLKVDDIPTNTPFNVLYTNNAVDGQRPFLIQFCADIPPELYFGNPPRLLEEGKYYRYKGAEVFEDATGCAR